MKYLVVLVVVVLVLWLARSARRAPAAREASPAKSKAIEDMVRCAHCGVHLPRSESHGGEGSFFCSQEHMRLHR